MKARICSFCHKREDQVGTLISNPSDYERAYICDECVRVSASVLAYEVKGMEDTHIDGNFVAVIRLWLAGPPDHPAALALLRKRAEALFGRTSADDSFPEDPRVA